MQLKIGDTVWLCDENRRVYDKTLGSGPIFRKHFDKFRVIGETRASWLLEQEWKIDKKTGRLRPPTQGLFGMHSEVYLSEQEVDDAVFVHDNVYAISERVRRVTSAGTLRAIVQMLDAKDGSR